MEQEQGQAELRRETHDYIESLKSEWHKALASFEVSKTIDDPRPDNKTEAPR